MNTWLPKYMALVFFSKVYVCHQSGRHLPDSDDTLGFNSWSLGAHAGQVSAPGGPKIGPRNPNTILNTSFKTKGNPYLLGQFLFIFAGSVGGGEGGYRRFSKNAKWPPILVSTPELAVIFRGESVSGHPGARGGPKSQQHIAPNCFVCFESGL